MNFNRNRRNWEAISAGAAGGASMIAALGGSLFATDRGIKKYFPPKKKRRGRSNLRRKVPPAKQHARLPSLDEIINEIDQKERMPKRYRRRKPSGSKRKRRRRRGRPTSRRRRRRRFRPSRAFMRSKLQDILAAPQTLKMAHSQLIEEPTSTNKCIFFTSHGLHDWYSYSKVFDASGEHGSFTTDALSEQLSLPFANQLHRLKNNTDYPVHLQATEFICRYDFRDSDYDGTGRHWAPNTWIEMLRQGLLSELSSADDATLSMTGGDTTNQRHWAFLTAPSMASLKTRTFLEIFKPIRKYKTRTLKPGDETRYKLTDKRPKKLIHHIHHNVSGNHTSPMFAGRTRFIIFKVWGTTIGTSEAEGANEDDEKVGSSTFRIHHEIFDTYVLKTVSPILPQTDWVDNRPSIGIADQEAIVDEEMNLDGPEQ